MRGALRVVVCVSIAALALATAITACDSPIEQSPCKDVPAGGCPLSHGQACEDPACAAAYACNPDGTWTLDHTCPAPDAGGGDASDASDGDAIDAALPLNDASWIDAPQGSSGGSGCVDLQQPDCPLATAIACPRGCCNCEDLYYCDNGTWTQWGACDADGGIHQ